MNKFVCVLLCTLLTVGCKDDKTNSDNQGPGPDPGPDPTPPAEEVIAEVDPLSWTSVDGLDRTIEPGVNYETPETRGEKTVGIFYFLWLGCHSYDTGLPTYTGGVQKPSATDVESPYDIQKLLNANPTDPALGPENIFHHWGEPYMGYYVSDDEWVIRKHAQMLSDAGVDVVLFDVTNGFTYLDVVKKVGDVYTAMRKEGSQTPQFAFVVHSGASETAHSVYRDIYLRGLYKDLWFQWDHKPLLLCNPDEVSSTVKGFFTIRHAWFLSNNSSADAWFGNGEDKWPWGSVYPQKVGTHNGVRECVSVMPATHPTSNIGRSYNVNTQVQPGPSALRSGEGIHFKAQFERAYTLDPQFLFFTGWNEWVAQRFISKSGGDYMLGKPLPAGGSYFVDQYNHEFSRDIEPLRGDYGDNYYYQMADFIRRFKGTKPSPTFTTTDTIRIDGQTDEWKPVQAAYADDKGDIAFRNHFGYGGMGQLVNTTGRNDIVQAKVANDGTYLYFFVKTASDITPYKDKNWMRLFINVIGSDKPNWEHFQYMINGEVTDETTTSLAVCRGNWNWETQQEISYRVEGSEMELAIPMASLGIKNVRDFKIDFKWIDNAVSKGDIQECLTDGDAAPNGRFRYRYQFKK